MNFHRSRLAFAFVVFCHQSLEFVHRSCTLKTTAGIACWCFRGHIRPEHRCLAQFSAPSGAVLFLRYSFDACCFHATVCRTTAVFFFFLITNAVWKSAAVPWVQLFTGWHTASRYHCSSLSETRWSLFFFFLREPLPVLRLTTSTFTSVWSDQQSHVDSAQICF